MPACQYVGKGEDKITLDGSIVPEFGSQLSLTALRAMGDTGKSFPLIAGNGKIYGLWVLDSVEETQTYFFKNGKPHAHHFKFNAEKMTKEERIKLFTSALEESRALLSAYPFMFPLESVITQLDYLVDVENGKAERTELNAIRIGQIAARDIENLSPDLAALLHKISAETKVM